MHILEINSFQKFEEYIQRKSYKISCFENFILQQLAKDLEEHQLFFVLKEEQKQTLEELKKQYNSKIKNLYTTHQPAFVGKVDQEKKFWVKKPEILLPATFKNQFSENFIIEQKGFLYQIKRTLLKDAFNKKEIKILYEDEKIQIFTLRLKIERITGGQQIEYFENGYYIKQENPSELILYDTPYWYHYDLIPYSYFIQKYGKEYVEQEQKKVEENLQILKRRRK